MTLASSFSSAILTLVLLNPIYPALANSVDPDQLASEEANWSGSALFAIKYVNIVTTEHSYLRLSALADYA